MSENGLICDSCHAKAEETDTECWNCGHTTFVYEPGNAKNQTPHSNNTPRLGRSQHSPTPTAQGHKAVNLSELLIELRSSLRPTDSFQVGWFKDAWFIYVDLDNSIKQRPLVPSIYGRTGDSPIAAVRSMLAALRQDKVIDLITTDSSQDTVTLSRPGEHKKQELERGE